MGFIDKWVPGETKLAVWAECCPKCGALELQCKGTKRPTSTVVHWQCCVCLVRWKGVHRKVSRGTIIAE